MFHTILSKEPSDKKEIAKENKDKKEVKKVHESKVNKSIDTPVKQLGQIHIDDTNNQFVVMGAMEGLPFVIAINNAPGFSAEDARVFCHNIVPKLVAETFDQVSEVTDSNAIDTMKSLANKINDTIKQHLKTKSRTTSNRLGMFELTKAESVKFNISVCFQRQVADAKKMNLMGFTLADTMIAARNPQDGTVTTVKAAEKVSQARREQEYHFPSDDIANKVRFFDVPVERNADVVILPVEEWLLLATEEKKSENTSASSTVLKKDAFKTSLPTEATTSMVVTMHVLTQEQKQNLYHHMRLEQFDAAQSNGFLKLLKEVINKTGEKNLGHVKAGKEKDAIIELIGNIQKNNDNLNLLLVNLWDYLSSMDAKNVGSSLFAKELIVNFSQTGALKDFFRIKSYENIKEEDIRRSFVQVTDMIFQLLNIPQPAQSSGAFRLNKGGR